MKDTKICVIGLGYVGLPLARLFSTKYKTIGFDMCQNRVDALMAGHDSTLEVSDELLQDAINGRNANYNRTMNLIDKLEEEGKITVLRPVNPLVVDRMEKDIYKLNALYQEGYELASKICFE